MTRAAIPALALAGLTTSAAAQWTGTVTLTSSATTVNAGDVFTIGVHLSDDIPGNSVFAFDLLVTGSGAAFSTVPDSLIDDPTASGFMFNFVGQINPDGAQGLGFAADLLPPTLDPSLDDLTVFTFQVRATQSGVLTFAPEDGPGTITAIETYAPGIVLIPVPYDHIDFESVTVNVIPAPSAAVILAFAGSLATRRQRRAP